MPDMLCSLVEIPSIAETLENLEKQKIYIRRANPWEASSVRRYVLNEFSENWADETASAFTHQPVTCYVATHEGRFVGFANYECTRKNYFGPTGVNDAYRGKGIGKALFIAALHGLRELGYSYCIIGGAGPVDFYAKAAQAMVIPFHEGRGIYDLKKDPGLYR